MRDVVWGGVIVISLLKVSVETLKHFALRIIQLYEQCAVEDRIGECVWHWLRWVKAGVALQHKPFKVWGHRGKLLLHPLLFTASKDASLHLSCL